MGMMIFPKGAYFPGFTLSAFMTGAIYGIFLYRKPVTIVNVSKSVVLITLLVDLVLNTLWLSMITGNAALALLVPRIYKSLIMLPIQVITVHVLWKYIGSHIDSASLAGR
jgi:ECF transporter S component (folate family)